MTITVLIKNVYGNDLIYPVCDKAIQFAKLTGKKTFSKHDLNIIRDLGYTIVYDFVIIPYINGKNT